MSPGQGRIALLLTAVVAVMVAATERTMAPGTVLIHPPWGSARPGLPSEPSRPSPYPDTTGPCYAIGFPGTPPVKTVDVEPVYPADARAARESGNVVLSIDVDADGNVRNPRIVRSAPAFDRAAIDAVTAWKFSPARLGKQPVCVTMTVTVRFSLQQP